MVVAMVMSFPLIGFEGQHALQALLFDTECGQRVSSGLSYRGKQMLTAGLFTVAATVVAAVVFNTSSVIALVGAACAIPIMYILPALFYLKVAREGNNVDPDGIGSASQGKVRPLLAVRLLLGVGVLTCLACLVSSVLGFKPTGNITTAQDPVSFNLD
jgi:hypothetical protein